MAPQKHGEAISNTTEHSPEYYQQLEDDMDVKALTQRVYQPKSEDLFSLVKRFWYR